MYNEASRHLPDGVLRVVLIIIVLRMLLHERTSTIHDLEAGSVYKVPSDLFWICFRTIQCICAARTYCVCHMENMYFADNNIHNIQRNERNNISHTLYVYIHIYVIIFLKTNKNEECFLTNYKNIFRKI